MNVPKKLSGFCHAEHTTALGTFTLVKTIGLCLIGLFLSVHFCHAMAASDVFSTLEKIVVGDEFTAQLKTMGTKVENPPEVGAHIDVYRFDSSFYSHPHFVYVETGKITFLQLAIPKEHYQRYNTIFASYGAAETTLSQSHSVSLYGFPSKGVAFIVNGISSQVERVQKFPVKNVQAFVSQEGKPYQPTPLPLPKTPRASEGKIQYQLPASFAAQPKGIQAFIVLVLLTLVIGVAFGLVRMLKRKPPFESPPGTPQSENSG